jgi:hypothetical protein
MAISSGVVWARELRREGTGERDRNEAAGWIEPWLNWHPVAAALCMTMLLTLLMPILA